jgi:hypothetical protein
MGRSNECSKRFCSTTGAVHHHVSIALARFCSSTWQLALLLMLKIKNSLSSGQKRCLPCRYIGNLHPMVTVSMLNDVCQYFGHLEQVKVIKVR